MAQAIYTYQVNQVTTGGPYSYVIWKNGLGFKSVSGLANIGAALDGIKVDIGGDLGTMTVQKIDATVNSST